MHVCAACQQPGAVSQAAHCRLRGACRDDGCRVAKDLPDAFLLPLFSLNQNDYGASEGDSSVGLRSVGELGHYGLLPCAWGYALMHGQADRPAALCGGPGLRSHAPTGVATLCGI